MEIPAGLKERILRRIAEAIAESELDRGSLTRSLIESTDARTKRLQDLREARYKAIKDFDVQIFPDESQHRGRPHCSVDTRGHGRVSVDIMTGEILAGDAGRYNREISLAVTGEKRGLSDLWAKMRPDDQKLK